MKMKLWLASSVAAVLLAAGAAVAADAPKQPITMKAKNGDVTFNHATHASMKCDACHPVAPMSSEPMGKDAAHKLCVDCHKTEAKGPTKCAECHKKA